MKSKIAKLLTHRKTLFFCLYTALFASVFLLTLFVLSKRSQEEDGSSVRVPVRTSGDETVAVLLLGHGGAGHPGGDLMDSIILLTVNKSAKKSALISIPRDLWIEGRKMNEGYVNGGFDLLKHQTNVVTGVRPEYYVAVDFGGFENIIDALGGVEVDVTKPYEDRFYPIKGKEADTCGKTPEEFAELHTKYSGFELERQFECRFEGISFGVGKVNMDGATALKYTRSRHGDGDFGRSRRQFEVLVAIKDEASSTKLNPKSPIIRTLLEEVRTNLDIAQIATLADFVGSPEDYKISFIHLTDENVLRAGTSLGGAFILLPREGDGKWTAVKKYIQDQFNL